MPPLKYHAGQVAVQQEANTIRLADNLSKWVGPVSDFALGADLILLANGAGSDLAFTVLSGEPPMVDVLGPDRLRLNFPDGGARPAPGRTGGLVISFATARRARLNGELRRNGDDWELIADETFTLCRKYVRPSVPLESRRQSGPCAAAPCSGDEAVALLARADTAFLASVSPQGGPDIAHRGGPPGFITFDTSTGELVWPEFLGDGVFKSAGNVRATGRLTLLAPDMETGDAIQCVCSGATYTNIRTSRQQRLDPLIQASDAHPVQGEIRATVEWIERLTAVMHPRRAIDQRVRVTSRSTVEAQSPQ